MTIEKKPNILWICTDQQRFDTLGCYGNAFVDTPNLDRLAQMGVLFENAFCQSPVCTPSRASFLTGRYPRTTRCRQNGQEIPEDEKLISKLFDEAGYVCGLSGKLHLSPCHPSVCKMERRIDDGYAEFHWSHGNHDGWPAHEYFQWLREKRIKYSRSPVKGTGKVKYGMDEPFHQTTWCIDKAIYFIEANIQFKRPWFFSANLFDPHEPFDPPKAYLEKYMDRLNELPMPNFVPRELENKPEVQKLDHIGTFGSTLNYPEMSEYEHKLVKAAYYSMIELIDKQVGRLLNLLEQTGQLDNTMIIFMSDHGEMLGDHGIYLKGPYFYDPLVNVPLIVSWPGVIKQGVRSKALVELTDIAPTLLAAIGQEPYPGMQGRSFWNLLIGQSELNSHRDSVYSEYYNAMPWHKNPTAYLTMVRDEMYKLVKVHGTGEGELYDLHADPAETHNRWDDAIYTDAKMKMLGLMCDRMAWTTDPLPKRLASF